LDLVNLRQIEQQSHLQTALEGLAIQPGNPVPDPRIKETAKVNAWQGRYFRMAVN
jgi:hypothetical protein